MYLLSLSEKLKTIWLHNSATLFILYSYRAIECPV